MCIFWLILVPDAPGFAQVLPFWIHGYDQGDLLDSEQAFDLLFAGDGCVNVSKAFEVDQAVDLVTCCKLTLYSFLCWNTRRSRYPVTQGF
jgi:hypothetical protein